MIWRHGISLDPFYRWKRKYSGVDKPELHRMQALDHWAEWRGVTLDFIRTGHPVESCFVESLNGRLCDERLNVQHFCTLEEAQTVIEAWRTEYKIAQQSGLANPKGLCRDVSAGP